MVLAAVNERYVQTDAQRKFLGDFIQRTGRPAGHIGFKREKEIFSVGDRADRAVYHDDPEFNYPSLSSVLAALPEVMAVYGSHAIPEGQQRVDWLLDPEDGQPFSRYAAHEILSPQPGAKAPDLKGKIVLIGPDFAGLDQHTLPFTVGKEKATFFPGIYVHAQVIAQILDDRFFDSWNSAQQFFLLLVIGLLGAAAGWPFHEMQGGLPRWDRGLFTDRRLERTVFHRAHAVSDCARHPVLGVPASGRGSGFSRGGNELSSLSREVQSAQSHRLHCCSRDLLDVFGIASLSRGRARAQSSKRRQPPREAG